jgi:hypothetical protein
MKLTLQQRQNLLRKRSVWIAYACDKCGKLLGSVRWTRRGELGEWCSAACLDGISAPKPPVAVSQPTAPRQRIGARPTGRPKKHTNNAEKQRSYRCRLKNVLTLRNTPSQQIENAQLPSAENRSHGEHIVRRTAAVPWAPIEASPKVADEDVAEPVA